MCISFPIKGKLKNYDFNVRPNNLKEFKFKIENNNIYLVFSE